MKKQLSEGARIAMAELVRHAEVCSQSTLQSVQAVGVIALRRALDIATGKVTVRPYRQRDMQAVMRWMTKK